MSPIKWQSKERLKYFYLFNGLREVSKLLLENVGGLHCFSFYRFLGNTQNLTLAFHNKMNIAQYCERPNTDVFSSSLFQCVRLFQFLGLFSELLDAVFHFLVLIQLLLNVVQKFPKETLSAASLPGQIPYLQETWLRPLVGTKKKRNSFNHSINVLLSYLEQLN